MISVTTTTNITAQMILVTITTNIILVVTANRNDLRDHSNRNDLSDLSNRNYRSDRSNQMILVTIETKTNLVTIQSKITLVTRLTLVTIATTPAAHFRGHVKSLKIARNMQLLWGHLAMWTCLPAIANTCKYVCTRITQARLRNRRPCSDVSESSWVSQLRILRVFFTAEKDSNSWGSRPAA
jgi:hypothetical protein